MPFSNYDELQEAIKNWLVRPDLIGDIPDFIRLAEFRVQQTLELRFTQKEATGNLTIGQDNIALPTDFAEAINLRIETSPLRTVEIVSAAKFTAIRERNAGDKALAGFVRGLTFALAPTPTAADGFTLLYWAGIAALTPSNTTNWLLDNAPNLLLYGSLLEAAPFIGNDERIGTWRDYYSEAATAIRRREWRARFAGGPVRVRPDTVV